MQQQWSAVDNYLIKALIPSDPVLDRVLENNHRAGLPAHDVAANQGQFLALLVRLTQAKRILEIGTLGGYSTIWMARELRALRYSRPGTLIIGDNVVRDGEVVNPQSADERVQGVRQFIEMMGAEPRLTATALQTVGTKGWDGFTLAWVNA